VRYYLRPLGLPGLAVLRSPPRLKDRLRPSYWWQAQLLDVLEDAQEREPSPKTSRRIDNLITGQRRANHGRLTNDYYDDMGWMALALLRAGRQDEAQDLWETISQAWNDQHGGGIPWRVQQPNYKNTPANGPAAILAARLGHRDWAQRIVDWMESVLIDTATGDVRDGIDRRGDGQLEPKWRFSYNYGVALAAELELGRREPAERIAAAGIARCAPDKILQGETSGDGALFKGIFARYLALLDSTTGREVVFATAAAMWSNRDAAGRFGPEPGAHTQAPVELSAMVSGVAIIEAAARLQRPGAPEAVRDAGS
jgi:predicted alpha-1,6-mannanase (GH76 family)